MMEGRAGIPAFWMAMTKGEEAAVPEPSLRRGSLEATRSPMMNCGGRERVSFASQLPRGDAPTVPSR